MRFVLFALLLLNSAARALEVFDLRCEDLVAPVGVDLTQPKLSWRLDDSVNTRGQGQTGYRILVASSAGQLAAGNGDLWDSGQLASAQSLRVPYGGASLSSRQRAFWKVRVWDKDGNPSAWSEPSEWTMGLLHPTDWSAKWIAHSASGLDGAGWIWFNEGNPPSSAPPGTRQFRRTITLPTDRTLTSAKVRITADDSFTLTINGQPVASGNDWTQPVSAEISTVLQAGASSIAISVTNAGPTPGPAGLIARFDFTFANGEPLTVVTDTAWKARTNVGTWSSALSLGAYGIAPWGSVSTATFPHPWMRRNFEVSGNIKRALVFVNTPGLFELYLNGTKVGDDVIAPAYSDFTKRMCVVAYDATALLEPGSNCIALWTAPGWYQPRCGNPHGSPIVRAQLDIETSAGSQSIGTDASWRTQESGITQVGNWGWAAAREITPPASQRATPADGSHTLTDDTHPEVQTWRFKATTREPRMFTA
jgi:alpha-L-rhamnosidase